MFFVYVLRSTKTQEFYTGQTNDLNRRLFQHNSGFEKSTKNKGPWELFYFEELQTRREAILKEKFLKTGKGREFIKSKLGSPPRRTKD